MAKTTTTTAQQSAPTPAVETTDHNAQIAYGNVVDSGKEEAGLILSGAGRARCQTAISAIETLLSVMQQIEIDHDADDGITATVNQKIGLIQAVSVCTEFLSEHIQGGNSGMRYAQFMDCDSPHYAHMEQVQVAEANHQQMRRQAAATAWAKARAAQ